VRCVRRDGDKLLPVTITRWDQCSACSCARDTRGEVSCWDERGREVSSLAARSVLHGARISANRRVVCAIGEGGRLECAPIRESNSEPVSAPALDHLVDVAVGENHSCAVTERGAVLCWGAGLAGQTGRGPSRRDPAPVTASTPSASSSAVPQPALRADHGVWCWGNDRDGIGDGDRVSTTEEPGGRAGTSITRPRSARPRRLQPAAPIVRSESEPRSDVDLALAGQEPS
jgi:hypothetical protein